MEIHGLDNRNGTLIERFTQETVRILSNNLVGVYLHGSAVMGCFHPMKSDLDLLVVVEHAMTDEVKREFMDMVIQLNDEAPAKGIEMSIVRREVCKPFAYPTPFELHFSKMHLGWYRDDPEDYIRKMNGTDRDLAAHCTVIRARGRCLYGAPIPEIFGEVSKQDYMDSLWYDIAEAAEEITEDTMYLTLNLARVLAFQQEGRVLSKQEGGEWALAGLPEIYHAHLRNALAEYRGEKPEYDTCAAKNYAAEMLRLIRDNMRPHVELESMTPACYERAMRIPRDNAAGRRFYVKHGFRETPYMEGDDCYMLRDL